MRNLLLLLTLCIFALLSGCKSDDGDNDSVSITFLSETEIVSTGKKYEVLIKSNTSWEVSLPVDWAEIDLVEGKGEKTCYLTLSENFGKDRTATITVNAGSAQNKLTFTQKGSKTTGLSQPKIEFNTSGAPVELSISSQSAWEIKDTETAKVPWVIFSKTKGTQGETITLTPTKQTVREPRDEVEIKIQVGSETKLLTLSQKVENTAPSATSITSLQNDYVQYTDNIVFNWTASSDPDGDPITYEILISKNNINWETLATNLSTTTLVMPDEKLGWDRYYWKVLAKDAFTSIESNIGMFTVDYLHYDNMVYVLKENTVPGCDPVNIVFIGDGYIKSDYNYNSTFNKHMQASMDAMFATEPYKTYKDYFKVSVIVAYSNEQGVSIAADFTSGAKLKKRDNVDCRFKSVCVGGNSTTIEIPSSDVRKYVNTQLGLSSGEDTGWAVFMLINVDAWAGSCTTWSNSGFSIAKSAADYNIGKRMVHEAGGHGIAKLADEYITNAEGVNTFPESEKTKLNERRNGDPWVYRANVDITNDRDLVHWKHYFTIPGYDKVGFYEGLLYTYGAWRAEEKSIMQGSSTNAGFNAPSREAIVRRIMFLAGQPFDFNDYLSKDKADFYVNPTRSLYYIDPNIKETPPEELDEHGRPV